MPWSLTKWNIHRPSRAGRFVRFWACGVAKLPKMWDSLPWTPMNRRKKFDAASFILGGEICNRTNKQTSKQVRPSSWTDVYPHMPILRVANALDESASARATRLWSSLHTNCTPAYTSFWATGEASGRTKFPKMGDFLLRTPMNRRAKFDAVRFILGGEIRNRTNTHRKQTNSKRCIHTLPIGMCG